VSETKTEHPVFAVVGRVNKGKSSIIATLAEDDRVAISRVPGTTRRCAEFPVRVDDEVLFTLVDTPGFEEAPRALAWLKQASPPDHLRAQRVEELVRAHEGTEEFVEERRLLRPILDGACILYVVDGTKPYRPNYQAEMEVLRWTGRPRMALINRIGEGDHSAEWQAALDQYFSVVRNFDAHDATFAQRIHLLETFRALHDPWADPLDRAIKALHAERARRRREVAHLVTELLVDELTFTLETRVEGAERKADEQRKLEDAFHDALREKERRARERVEALYKHRIEWDPGEELERPTFDQDLFAKKTWDVLGLKPTQLLAIYTVSGAVTGGAVDASVGGATFLAGAGIGALIGAGAGLYHLQRRYARAASVDGAWSSFRRAFSGGSALRVGPHANPNFPFVLLDRALLHWEAVRDRAHARKDKATLTTSGELAQDLEKADRDALHDLFTKVRKSYSDVPRRLRESLFQRVVALVERPTE
jgi:Domain of unknown function (DUF3482)/50S ribosome-binding GTPase